MTFKEKCKIFINYEKQLEKISEEKEEKRKELISDESKLKSLKEEISKKEAYLESLKREVVELKSFIDDDFKNNFGSYDYTVNIENCYVIELNNKKYITIRKCISEIQDCYTLAFGNYIIDNYYYYDVLDRKKDKSLRLVNEYVHGYFLNISSCDKIKGYKPIYEEHILKVCPELVIYYDNKVPNTHLKKIFYEINDLGSKKKIKKN